jgi:hypothetical protein
MLKQKKTISILILLVMILGSTMLMSWGFWAHQRINRMAIFCLPQAMMTLYKPNIEYITAHAVDPDKRRYGVEAEAPRHYIDLDHYGFLPFDNVPRKWKDAVAKYTEDTLQAYGIVPWHVQMMQYRLIEAFRTKNKKKILQLSAEIGHYIGDAHVPLHTTENYNGQLTNQHGIHGFWESRVPELFGDEYDYWLDKAVYIENINKTIWQIVFDSHRAKDSVLLFEKKLNLQFDTDKKYGFENKGSLVMKTYSKEYTAAYSKMLNGMVERRLRAAIISVASFWYTAWVDAGQPDLKNLPDTPPTEEEIALEKKMEADYKDGKAKGKGHDD